MSRVSRRSALRAVVVSALLAVLLSGCIEVRIESVFEDDLSAVHALQTTIERQGLDQLAAMGGEEVDPFEDSEQTREEAEAAGFTYEEIDTEEFVGWRVSKNFDDSSDLGGTLNRMFEESDPEAEAVNTFNGTLEKDGSTFRLNLTINSDDVFEDQEDTDDLGMDPADLFSFVYIATMPGKVTETNGEIIGDNQVRWDLPITGTATLTAVSEEEGAGGGASTIIIIAALVALVLAALAAGYFVMQRRRQPATLGATPAAATGIPPMTAGAGMASSAPVVTGTGETLPPVDVQPEPQIGPDDDTRPLPRA